PGTRGAPQRLFRAPQARHPRHPVARVPRHPASAVRPVIYPRAACALGRTISVGARRLPLRSPASVKRSTGGTGLSTRCPSPTANHALGLGPANPTRTYLASEPLGFRRASFPLALSLLIPASALLTTPATLPSHLHCCEDAPLPKDTLADVQSAASATGLAPVHCRRTRTRPVSYY